jgi:hypothetical protein
VATSLTFETTVCSILSVNPALALLLLTYVPGAPVVAAPVFGVCSDVLSVFPAFFAEFLTVPDFAANVTFFAGSVFREVFEAGFVAAFLTGFAALLVAGLAAGFAVALTVDLPGFATAFPADPAVFVLDGMTADFAATLPGLLAAALLVADLVTVAFMVPSFPMNCPVSRDFA